VAQGLDANRLAMLLAILSRHAGIALSEYDVFANLVGGLEIRETATDLPLVLALVSSLKGQPLPEGTAAFGELGLTGEVRPVAGGEERLRELRKQGYTTVILPRQNAPKTPPEGLALRPVTQIAEAVRLAL
jgi:DNA repair protein RadA/Sms